MTADGGMDGGVGMPHGRLVLAEHDPAWARAFAVEAAAIRAALGDLVVAVEHIGSTAVPGLLAKPVVDIGVAVPSVAAAEAAVAPLEARGYEHRGMHGDDPARRYFVLDREGRRVFQLHLWIVPTPAWERHLAFRDLLRARPDLADAYAEEKRRVAEATGWDKGAYSLAKGPFIDRLSPHV